MMKQMVSNKRQLVDPKGIGKPTVFKSEQGKWPHWAFKFENLVNSIFSRAREVLLWAANHEDARITQTELRHEFLEPSLGEAIPDIIEMDDQ